MGLLNVSQEEWESADYLLTGKPEGTKLKHQYGAKQKKYQYISINNQLKEIRLNHSFIVAEGQIWALPNTDEKRQALLGKGAFAKVSIRENKQGDTRLHRTFLKHDMHLEENELQRIKKEQAIAYDVGLIYSSITKQYYNKPGKREGNLIMIMPYEDNPQDLEKKYHLQQKVIPLSTTINAFTALQRLHTGALSKTGEQYLHRDIKLANIVENDNGIVTLIDYGFAMTKTCVDQSFCGSLITMSPEIYHNLSAPEYSESSDVYALTKAVLIHEFAIKFPKKYQQMMLLNKQPFMSPIDKIEFINNAFNQILKNLTNDERNTCIYLSNDILLNVVLQPKAQRPTIENMLEALTNEQQNAQQNDVLQKNQPIDDIQQNVKNKLSIRKFYRHARAISAPFFNTPPLNQMSLNFLSHTSLSSIKHCNSYMISSTNQKASLIKLKEKEVDQTSKYSIPLTSSKKTTSLKMNSFEVVDNQSSYIIFQENVTVQNTQNIINQAQKKPKNFANSVLHAARKALSEFKGLGTYGYFPGNYDQRIQNVENIINRLYMGEISGTKAFKLLCQQGHWYQKNVLSLQFNSYNTTFVNILLQALSDTNLDFTAVAKKVADKVNNAPIKNDWVFFQSQLQKNQQHQNQAFESMEIIQSKDIE
ncbi:protein kinase domain-containing protein [Facilibium subflavum]|uniref:protein kinase domain-containing protein n=1 Tax=Facilibium subflavum TaxID=2219058 RepID=UPI000E651825|nr:protein kinase [Facilibium subflavum]